MSRMIWKSTRLFGSVLTAAMLVAGLLMSDVALAQKVVTPPSAPAPITRPNPPKVPGKPAPPKPVVPNPTLPPNAPTNCPINTYPVYSPITNSWACVVRPPAPSCRPGFMAIFNPGAGKWICVKGTPVSN